MSGSPKYHSVSLGAQVAQAVDSARERREQRRREEEERQRWARLADARISALDRHARLTARFAALEADATAAGAWGSSQPARDDLRTVAEHIRAAADMDQVRAALSLLDEGDHGLVELRARIAAAHRIPVADSIAAVRHLLDEVDLRARERFDPVGAAAVAQLLRPASGGASVAPDQVCARAGAHLRATLAGKAAYEQLCRRAAVLVDDLDARCQMLAGDAAQAGTTLPNGDLARDSVAMLRAELADDRPDEVLRLGEFLRVKLGELETALDAGIDRITERRAILGALARTLPTLGYAVDVDSLQEHPDGTIAVRAQRHSGERLAVQVDSCGETEHRVLYTSDAMQSQTQVGAGGPGSACDSLLSVIEQMNQSARGQGFTTGAIGWAGDDQRRPPPARAAQPPSSGRPSAGQHSAEQQHGQRGGAA